MIQKMRLFLSLLLVSSAMVGELTVDDAGGAERSPATDPAVRKQYVQLPVPSRGDDAADLVRLERAVGPFEVGLELLRSIPSRLRERDFAARSCWQMAT